MFILKYRTDQLVYRDLLEFLRHQTVAKIDVRESKGPEGYNLYPGLECYRIDHDNPRKGIGVSCGASATSAFGLYDNTIAVLFPNNAVAFTRLPNVSAWINDYINRFLPTCTDGYRWEVHGTTFLQVSTRSAGGYTSGEIHDWTIVTPVAYLGTGWSREYALKAWDFDDWRNSELYWMPL